VNLELARKKLYEAVDFERIPVEEYQNKYYFLKKIKNIFPDISEEKIADAISYANKEVRISGKKKKFVNALSIKIFSS
jgi:hypothetical protein